MMMIQEARGEVQGVPFLQTGGWRELPLSNLLRLGYESEKLLLGKIKNRFVGSKLLKPNNKQCSGWIVSDTLPFDKDSWSFGVKNKVGSGSERMLFCFSGDGGVS